MYEILSYDHTALAGESSEKIPWFCAAVLAKKCKYNYPSSAFLEISGNQYARSDE